MLLPFTSHMPITAVQILYTHSQSQSLCCFPSPPICPSHLFRCYIHTHKAKAFCMVACTHACMRLLMTDEVMKRLHIAARLHVAGQRRKRRKPRKNRKRKRKRKRRKSPTELASEGHAECLHELREHLTRLTELLSSIDSGRAVPLSLDAFAPALRWAASKGHAGCLHDLRQQHTRLTELLSNFRCCGR